MVPWGGTHWVGLCITEFESLWDGHFNFEGGRGEIPREFLRIERETKKYMQQF